MNARKARFLQTMAGTVNPITVRLARSGHGPFALVRHVGRKTGRTYETRHGVEYTIDRIDHLAPAAGRGAYGFPAALWP